MRRGMFERFRGGAYRQYPPTDAADRAATEEHSQDLSEVKSTMMAEMGVYWLVGPDIRGLNLDYARGRHSA